MMRILVCTACKNYMGVAAVAPKAGKSSSSPGLVLFIVLTVKEVTIKVSDSLLITNHFMTLSHKNKDTCSTTGNIVTGKYIFMFLFFFIFHLEVCLLV